MTRIGAYRRDVVASVASALLVIGFVSASWAQDQATSPVGPARKALAEEIAQLKTDIAEIERLSAWQREMLRAASSNPSGVLGMRRPMSACLASPLAPVCHSLTALFVPHEGAGEPAP